jgi:hypothetical protein
MLFSHDAPSAPNISHKVWRKNATTVWRVLSSELRDNRIGNQMAFARPTAI